MFSTLANVSIYSVYFLVVNGVKTLFTSVTGGIQALLGELWARREINELKKTFSWTEWTIHTGAVFVFGCTASLICPFIQIYTLGVEDANYYAPLFGFLLTTANTMHSLRLPYNIMILAGGHYKQTQSNYIIAAVMNLVISIFAVSRFGLVGVAIGTLSAMLYQTIWMAVYVSKNFLLRPIKEIVKHLCVDALSFGLSYWLTSFIVIKELSYSSWIVLAIKTAVIWLTISCITNYIAYPNFVKRILSLVHTKIKQIMQ